MPATTVSPWRRWLPLAVLAAAIAGVFLAGGHKLINFDEIARDYAALSRFIAADPVPALLVACGLYAAAIAISLPAAWLLTVAMGLLFGWAAGSAIVIVGATLGASMLFWATRLALAPFFARRAGPWLNKFAAGFRRDAASYLLSLRLAPVVPFTLLNVIPAIFGVRFATFFWTTLVGIIPGTLAYTVAGEGLRSIVSQRAAACDAGVPPCGLPLQAFELVTPQILIAFTLLAVVSLLPVILKRFRAQRAKASGPQ